ncbi:MAG: uracil-DNA glycosylase [Chromatiales bacterium]|jgi:DNA polymerase|nr:uracil-DNA glycosylase [Chromatiales bacterium]
MDRRALDYLHAMGIQPWAERRVAVEVLTPLVPEEPITDGGPGWEELEAQVRVCTRCDLYRTRQNPVFGVGNRSAELMIIGEAPGAEEDRRGEPFVGRAGQLLNEMLVAIGLAREAVYIANVLKSRPLQNRDPRPDEVAACEPYLRRQLALVRPKLILAVGRIASQNLLKTDTRIGTLRGRVHDYAGTPLVVTYHPAYLLRTPLDKRKAWDDLRLVVRLLSGVA